MKEDKTPALTRKLTEVVTSALREIHEQFKGVRVTSVAVEKENLQPSGLSYSIRISAQVSDIDETPSK